MSVLINRPFFTWITGLAFAIVAGLWEPATTQMYQLLVENSGTLLGTTVSLMGFVIAALAIVLATPSQSVRLIKKKSPQLWKKLTSLFTQASSTFGLASAFLLIAVAAAPSDASGWPESIWAALFVGLIVICMMQITKVIGLLDLVIQQA